MCLCEMNTRRMRADWFAIVFHLYGIFGKAISAIGNNEDGLFSCFPLGTAIKLGLVTTGKSYIKPKHNLWFADHAA